MKRTSLGGLVFFVGFASAASACSSDDEPTATAGAPLPCEVERVLAENCRRCHGAEPKFGAPMSLASWDDLMRPAPSDGARAVWERVGERIHDSLDPMPPTGSMDAGELSVLDAWLAQGRPRGSGACTDVAAPPPEPGPDTLPCAPTDFFRASDGAGGGFAVPVDQANYNHCFIFRSPWQDGTQGVAFAPIIDDARVVHHWILFSTERDLPEGSFPCDGNMPLDSTFITGWAPGAGNNVLPPDVGLELPGAQRSLILQLHYWNAAGYADARDRSGVAVCATSTDLRPNTAAVHTLGTLDIAIPERSASHEVSGTCTPIHREPIHVIGSGPHMHRRGLSLHTMIERAGDPARSEPLVAVDHWDFEGQRGYRSSATIMPGDVLRTTCRYMNETSRTIYFGERTEDEMCFNFVLAYPPGSLVNSPESTRRTCIDR